MFSSAEVLTLLLKVMGLVIGIAIFLLAVFLLARNVEVRTAGARLRDGALILAHFIRGVVAEYAKTYGSACSSYLLSKGRKIAKTFLT